MYLKRILKAKNIKKQEHINVPVLNVFILSFKKLFIPIKIHERLV